MRVVLRLIAVIVLALPAVAQESTAALVILSDAPSASTAVAAMPYTPLTHRQKLAFAARNTIDPSNLLGAALESGISQLNHDNLGFGQGAEGFGGRYGAALLDRAAFNLFSQSLFASAFHRDPRYEPMHMGPFGRRVKRVISSAIRSRKDDGSSGFNTPVVLGAIASGALSNAYYPAKERGAVFTVRSSALNFSGVVGTRLLTEFLPDIKRKVLRRK